MAIIEKTPKRLVIDLTGPDGNAFSLLAYAKTLGKQLGLSGAEIEAIRADMMSGDYEHLIQAFDDKFGKYVDLER